eukprot:bmy_08475T0
MEATSGNDEVSGELTSVAHAVSLPAESYGNDPDIEMAWAMRAMQHAEDKEEEKGANNGGDKGANSGGEEEKGANREGEKEKTNKGGEKEKEVYKEINNSGETAM